MLNKQEVIDESTIPHDCFCPITQEIMEDPVIADDKHTYERAAIEKWFSLGPRRSPKTGAALLSTELIPNYALCNTIEALKKQHSKLARHKLLSEQSLEAAIKLQEQNIQGLLEQKGHLLDQQDKTIQSLQRENEGMRRKMADMSFSCSSTAKATAILMRKTADDDVQTAQSKDRRTAIAVVNKDEIWEKKALDKQSTDSITSINSESLTFFKSSTSLPPLSEQQDLQDKLPLQLKESLKQGDFNSELANKELNISYNCKVNLITEEQIKAEAMQILCELQQCLQQNKTGIIQYAKANSLVGDTLTIITNTDDAEELKEFLEDENIIEKLCDKLNVNGDVRVTLKDKELKIYYRKKDGLITETEFNNNVTNIFDELQKYLKQSNKNNLIINFSNSNRKNSILIKTQYTDDAQELQELLQDSGILRKESQHLPKI